MMDIKDTAGRAGDNDRVRDAQVYPVLRGEVVERQQFAEVVGDLRDGFGEFGAIGQLERGDGAAGVVAVLGVPDLGQGLLRTGVRGLR
jgi:hypothetical protein